MQHVAAVVVQIPNRRLGDGSERCTLHKHWAKRNTSSWCCASYWEWHAESRNHQSMPVCRGTRKCSTTACRPSTKNCTGGKCRHRLYRSSWRATSQQIIDELPEEIRSPAVSEDPFIIPPWPSTWSTWLFRCHCLQYIWLRDHTACLLIRLSGRFTHISGHPSAAGRAQDRERLQPRNQPISSTLWRWINQSIFNNKRTEWPLTVLCSVTMQQYIKHKIERIYKLKHAKFNLHWYISRLFVKLALKLLIDWKLIFPAVIVFQTRTTL